MAHRGKMQPMKLLHKKKGEDMFQMYSFVSLITSDELVETLFLYYCGRKKCYYKAILILTSIWSLTVHLCISPWRIFSVSLKWEANASFSEPIFWTVPLLVCYWNIKQYNLARMRTQSCYHSAPLWEFCMSKTHRISLFKTWGRWRVSYMQEMWQDHSFKALSKVRISPLLFCVITL